MHTWHLRGTQHNRLLHRRTDDELMGEVPTVRVDSLHAACDRRVPGGGLFCEGHTT